MLKLRPCKFQPKQGAWSFYFPKNGNFLPSCYTEGVIRYLFLLMPLLARWLVNALLFLVVAAVLPDSIHIAGIGTALIVALLWGLLTTTLKPILIVLTLPVNILTLGLFTFFINAFLFWFLAQVVKGFEVDSFGAAFFGALILSVLHLIAGTLLKKRGE